MVNSREDIEVYQKAFTIEQRILTQLLKISEEDIIYLKELERVFEFSEMKRVSYSIDPYRSGKLMVSIDSENLFKNLEDLKEYCADNLKISESRLFEDYSLNPNKPGVANKKLNGYYFDTGNFSLYFKVA